MSGGPSGGNGEVPWSRSVDQRGDTHIIYRLAPNRPSNQRPGWFDPGACLRSFFASVDVARDEGLSFRTTIVLDGDVDASLRPELGRFDASEHVDYKNNSKSFRHTLELGVNSAEENIMYAEDDYVWAGPAITATIRALAVMPRVRYASPFSHPAVGGRRGCDLRRHRTVQLAVGHRQWQSTVDTTMTFGVRRDVLRDDFHYWWLASYGKSPKDIWAFAAIIEGRWLRLVGNAAYRDWRRVANLDTAKLVGECTLRRVKRSNRPLLIQPVDEMAVHVHGPTVPDEAMWREISARFARSERHPASDE